MATIKNIVAPVNTVATAVNNNDKEVSTMTTTNTTNTVNVNNIINNTKEDKTMTAINNTINATINDNTKEVITMKNEQTLKNLEVTNVKEEWYMTKAAIYAELQTFGVSYSKTEYKKTSRKEMAEELTKLLNEAIEYGKQMEEMENWEAENESMPVKDCDRRWNTLSPKKQGFFKELSAIVQKNEKTGWGTAISAFMLKAVFAKHFLKCPNLSEAYKKKLVTPEAEEYMKKAIIEMVSKGWFKVVTAHRSYNTLAGPQSYSVGIKNEYGIGGPKYKATILVNKIGKVKLEDVGMFGVNKKALNEYLTELVEVKQE